MSAHEPSTHRLLTLHFLRQFLENDLVSPDSDRKQLLALVSAAVLSGTLLVSTLMSFLYLGPMLTPGLLSVLSLSDKFFYLSLAMIVTALVAASQWDALAVDARDAAILEPLPVRAGAIRRAKLSAVAILGVAAAVGINLAPTVVFPPLLVFQMRELSLFALLWLIVAHAIVSMSAAVFGYVLVIALRETMVALLGGRWFTRVSPWVQGLLIVVLGGSLLLLPPAASNVAQRAFDDWRADSPPMWFLGVYEVLAGHVLADLPRGQMRPRQAANDRLATERYDARRPLFSNLARRAGLALVAVFAIAALASLWNARRMPSLAPISPPAYRRRWGVTGTLANALLLRHGPRRAGFYFALAVMWRNNTHRLTLACAAAVGIAMLVVALTRAEPGARVLSASLLVMQPFLYGALLVGFRHVIRVPAELRANWGFQLAWGGHEAEFTRGVRYAAIAALVLPALALLFPFYTFVLGARPALMHGILGLAGAMVLLEALMVSYDKVPFTCSYLPSDNMKALGPIYVLAFVIGAITFARLQRDALQTGNALPLLATLAVLFVALRIAAVRRTRLPQVQFDEAPASFQRLGLDS